jgi:ketosteroid isomerase-like protein
MGTVEERNTQTVERWAETWNNDVMRMVDEIYAPDCEVVDVIRDRSFTGREALRAVEQQMIGADPTRRMVITRSVAQGDTVAVEIDSYWQSDAVRARACVVLTFGEDGLIVSDHTYAGDPTGVAG